MKVWGMSLGGFPRSRLARHTLRDCEKGILTRSECERRLIKVHAEAIGIQKGAGLPVVVDGMVDWHDIFRPFIRSWRNVSVDGLLRYFDNNFFYRIPVFTGEPDIIEPVWNPRILEYSKLADPAVLKAVFPGPLTFAMLAKNNSSLTREELAARIAYLLRREIDTIVENGSRNVWIQVDEPILSIRGTSVDDARFAVDLFNDIVRGFENRSVLAVYFDAPDKGVYEALLEVRSKYLFLDVADTPKRALPLVRDAGFGGHTPVLGIVDGRRIFEDRVGAELVNALRTACSGCEELVVSSSTWFDLIPYKYVLNKIFIINKIVNELASQLGGEAYTLWSLNPE